MAKKRPGMSLPRAIRHSAKQNAFRRERIARTTARIHEGRGARIAVGPRGGVKVIDRRGRSIPIDWKMFDRLPETVEQLRRRREELRDKVDVARDAEEIRHDIERLRREHKQTGLLDSAAQSLEGFWSRVSKVSGGVRKRGMGGVAFKRGGNRGGKNVVDELNALRDRYKPDFERALGLYEGESPLRDGLDRFKAVGSLRAKKSEIRAKGREMLEGVRGYRENVQAEMARLNARIGELEGELEHAGESKARERELEFLEREILAGREKEGKGDNLSPAELAKLHGFYRNFHREELR